MAAIDPDNLRWRMEIQYANANLGIVLYSQRRFAEAAVPLQASAPDDPGAGRRRPDEQRLSEECCRKRSAGWPTRRCRTERIGDAIAIREQQIALLKRLLSRSQEDVFYRLRLIRANQTVGELYALQGRLEVALDHLQSAVDDTDPPCCNRAGQYARRSRWRSSRACRLPRHS